VCGGVIIVGGAGAIDEEFGSIATPATPVIEQLEAEPALVGTSSSDIAASAAPSSAVALPPASPTPARPQTPAIPRPLTPPAGLFKSPVPATARPSAGKSAPAVPSAAPSGPPQRPVVFSPRAASGGPGGQPTAPPKAAPSAPRPAISPRPFSGAGAPTPARNASVTPGRAPINPFLANDPNAKARRLARALISDLVTYFPERREEGLRTGTLRDLFAEEIKKSYEEYVEQVGREFADSTSHFKDALNEILAGGQSMF
jgi:hypothetical protein